MLSLKYYTLYRIYPFIDLLSSRYYILFRLCLTRSGSVSSPRHPLRMGRGWLCRLRSWGKRRRDKESSVAPYGKGYHFSGLFIPRYTARVRLTFRSGPLFRKQGAPTRSTLGLAPLTVCRYQVPRDGACQSSTPAVLWQLPVPPVFGLVARRLLGPVSP